MEIPINVEVFCQDGPAGRVSTVVINPTTDRLTHLVVQRNHQPHEEYLVPVSLIASSTPQKIQLSISKEALYNLVNFLENQFVHVKFPHVIADPYYAWPFVTPEDKTVLIEHEQVPPGELAVHRGARVEATDGYVGKVDEFLVEPKDTQITHLVLREGHLWAARDISIPISQIDHINNDTVHLKINKQSVGELPEITIQRNEK